MGMNMNKITNCFLLGEKYRLELIWDSVEYISENKCVLHEAYFYGPALKLAEKINSNDYIELDFYNQYYVVVESIYVCKLYWGEVEYDENKVNLKNCYLSSNDMYYKVPKLNDDDIIIIDTNGHDSSTHHLFLNYKAYIVNRDYQLYSYK